MQSFCLIVGFAILGTASATSLNVSCMLKEFIPTDEHIRLDGYPAESHLVETIDGYVLNLYRIPYSFKSQNRNGKRPAILLQHGLFSNSDCWLAVGKDYALAYLLADAGFDVWLGNARGNIYSRYNTGISNNSPKFWKFGWHEIGTIDVPTMIDLIIDVTGEEQIHYVGHSQGTTVYFVMMSERPEYNRKIKSAHMLAPCAFFEHSTADVFKVLSPLVGKPGGLWNMILSDTELMPHNDLIIGIGNTACGTDPALKIVCKNLWLLFAGDNYKNTNLTAMQVLVETHPAGISSNQAIHYVQLNNCNKGRFCKMDYGEKQNSKIYHKKTPPDYELDNINAATYFYSAANDILCVPKDVDTLANTLHLAGNYLVPEKSFSHLDFIIASNLKEMVNDLVIKNIQKY